MTIDAPLTARIVSGAPSCVSRAEALEDNPDLDPAEPGPAQELEPPPHPLLDVVAELPGGLRGVSGPAYVFMVDEELGGVRSFVDARNREDRESRRTSPNPIDELGVFPSLLDFGHPALVQAGQRFCDDAARSHRVRLADPQVRGQVMRIPPFAERGCVRPDLVEQVAQLGPFGLWQTSRAPIVAPRLEPVASSRALADVGTMGA